MGCMAWSASAPTCCYPHADARRGREALAALDFYVHADLFMNPTAELADIVLPVASAFEREALKIGFEISQEAQSLVQLRQRVVAPQGEARSDTEIIFDLASRPGSWRGTSGMAISRPPIATSSAHPAYRWRTLREQPGGVRLPSRRVTANLPSRRTVARRASRPQRERSNCTRRRCWSTAIHRCPSTKSR